MDHSHYRIGRHELLHAWEQMSHKLEQLGECNQHLGSFVGRVRGLQGDQVGDILFHWGRRQAEQRLFQSFLVLLTGMLATLASLSVLGWGGAILCALSMVALSAGLYSHHLESEQAFADELELRARYLLHCPFPALAA
jgi:hypothetical protein